MMVKYEVDVGTGCTSGSIYVNDNATDEEIEGAILNDLYWVDWHKVQEVIKNETTIHK